MPWKPTTSRLIYQDRLNQVHDFINQHITENITLDTLSAVAGFSPYHFHRIFSTIVGETPPDFINRLRLEKAANMLVKNPACNITEIAFSCGFSSSSVFSRSFKKQYGLSASQFRRRGYQGFVEPRGGIAFTQPGTLDAELLVCLQNIRIQNMPAWKVIYTACMEGYIHEKITQTWQNLYTWACAQNLITPETKMIGLSLDDPDITPAEKCRYYACITVPEKIKPAQNINYLEIPGGKHAVGRFSCYPHEIQHAYWAIYGTWLPDSGYQPAAHPTYEIYYQAPENHPADKFYMDICIPVQSL